MDEIAKGTTELELITEVTAVARHYRRLPKTMRGEWVMEYSFAHNVPLPTLISEIALSAHLTAATHWKSYDRPALGTATLANATKHITYRNPSLASSGESYVGCHGSSGSRSTQMGSNDGLKWLKRLGLDRYFAHIMWIVGSVECCVRWVDRWHEVQGNTDSLHT